MIGSVAANVFRIVGLLLLQSLVIDRLDIANGWIMPYLYVLGLLLLPLNTPPWATLLIGFATGYAMDFFTNTPGLHASACTVFAFTRPFVLRLVEPRDGYEFGRRPTIAHMGMPWFLTYAGLLILVHHLWLFFAEVYRFSGFFSTFTRAILGGIATMGLCLLIQTFVARPGRART